MNMNMAAYVFWGGTTENSTKRENNYIPVARKRETGNQLTPTSKDRCLSVLKSYTSLDINFFAKLS